MAQSNLLMSLKKIFKYELNTIGWFGFIITLIILIMYCCLNAQTQMKTHGAYHMHMTIKNSNKI